MPGSRIIQWVKWCREVAGGAFSVHLLAGVTLGLTMVPATGQVSSEAFHLTVPRDSRTAGQVSLRADMDWDRDGVKDLLVASLVTSVLDEEATSVRVISGKTGKVLLALHAPEGSIAFGHSCSFLADVDGDTIPEIAVGDPAFDDGRGAVFVFHGATGETAVRLVGEAAGDQFGWAIDGVGDTNGDGRGNLVVGAPGRRHRGIDAAGAVYVYGGTLKKGKFKQQLMLAGSQTEGRFGESVTSGADFRGDGSKDLLIGAPGERKEEQDAVTGAVHVFDGRKGRKLFMIRGERAGGRLGAWTRWLADVNGDSMPDVLTVAGGSSQYVMLISGKTGEVIRTWHPEGATVTAMIADRVGDFDGDCVDEIAVSWRGAGDGSAAGEDRMVILSAISGKVLSAVPVHGGAIRCIAAFSRLGNEFGGGVAVVTEDDKRAAYTVQALLPMKPDDG